MKFKVFVITEESQFYKEISSPSEAGEYVGHLLQSLRPSETIHIVVADDGRQSKEST